MKRTFDNFQAVDRGFTSFIGRELLFSDNNAKLDALISSLDQKYQDALAPSNLDFHLNTQQRQDLTNALNTIANDTTLSGSAKITNAITTIQNALPYLKTSVVIMTRTPPVINSTPSPSTTTNMSIPVQQEQNTTNSMSEPTTNTTKSTEGDEKPPFDIVKIGLIVVAVGIVGYMGYVAIKK
jgi:hypothetical protein